MDLLGAEKPLSPVRFEAGNCQGLVDADVGMFLGAEAFGFGQLFLDGFHTLVQQVVRIDVEFPADALPDLVNRYARL